MKKIIVFAATISICTITYSAQNQLVSHQSSYQPLSYKEEWEPRQLPEADNIKNMLVQANHHQLAKQTLFIRNIARQKFVYPTLETFAYNERHRNPQLTEREAQEGSWVIFRASKPVEPQASKLVLHEDRILEFHCSRAIFAQLPEPQRNVIRWTNILPLIANKTLAESEIYEIVINACTEYNRKQGQTAITNELADKTAQAIIATHIKVHLPTNAKL